MYAPAVFFSSLLSGFLPGVIAFFAVLSAMLLAALSVCVSEAVFACFLFCILSNLPGSKWLCISLSTASGVMLLLGLACVSLGVLAGHAHCTTWPMCFHLGCLLCYVLICLVHYVLVALFPQYLCAATHLHQPR